VRCLVCATGPHPFPSVCALKPSPESFSSGPPWITYVRYATPQLFLCMGLSLCVCLSVSHGVCLCLCFSLCVCVRVSLSLCDCPPLPSVQEQPSDPRVSRLSQAEGPEARTVTGLSPRLVPPPCAALSALSPAPASLPSPLSPCPLPSPFPLPLSPPLPPSLSATLLD